MTYKYNDIIVLYIIKNVRKNGEVIPIEVKAGNDSTPSLNSFINKYHPKVSYKFVNGNVGFLDGKKTLPHYMVMFI